MATYLQPELNEIELVLATGNQGKVREIRKLTEGFPVSWRSLADLAPAAAPDETGATFVDNALIKAVAAWQQSGLTAIADDSGLVVDALNGAPGVQSARFAGKHGDDAANIQLLLAKLAGLETPNRTACFRCAAALVAPWSFPLIRQDLKRDGHGIPVFESNTSPTDGYTTPDAQSWVRLDTHPLLPPGTFAIIAEGQVDGIILPESRGSGGFGYDPVFFYPPLEKTFAELSTDEKNRLSHRAIAIKKLLSWLNGVLNVPPM